MNLNDQEVPPSHHHPIPGWLKWTYCILPFWGIFTFYLYWNGSSGWLDRGAWEGLQKASNTIYPFNSETADQVAKREEKQLSP